MINKPTIESNSQNILNHLLINIDVGYFQLLVKRSNEAMLNQFFVMDMNEKFAGFIQKSRNVCAGKNVKDVIPVTERYWFELMEKLAQGDSLVSFEGYNSDESLYFKIRGYRLDDDKIVLLLYDLTDRVRYEEDLKERNEEINTQNEEFRSLNEELSESYEALNNTNEKLIVNEKLLEESQKMLQLVLDHIPVRVFWKDLNSNYMGCNKRFAEDAGKSLTEEVVGNTDFDFFANDIGTAFRADDKLVMDTGEPKLNFEELQNQEGEEARYLRTNKVPLVNDLNEVIGVLGTYEDISVLKRIQQELIEAKEKAEESDRLKSAFLANMSHEIRTPMNGIVGFAQLLNDDGISNKKRAYYINIINDSSEQLLRIVNDIIDISKIEAGQLDVNEELVDFEKVINDSIRVYSKSASNKHIDILLNNETVENNRKIVIDGTKLRQVIDNLLSNAVKFTHKGSVEVNCNMKSNLLKISVCDTGIGISKMHYKAIFDRFHQIDGFERQRDYGGTGLGLSICQGLVKKLGGNIRVESELEVGSCFYVELPFKSIEDGKN